MGMGTMLVHNSQSFNDVDDDEYLQPLEGRLAFYICIFSLPFFNFIFASFWHFKKIIFIFCICRHFKEDFEQAIVQLSEPLIDASLDLYK